MKNTYITLVTVFCLGTLFAIFYPHTAINPGKLTPGHINLEKDCFACHAPFTGNMLQKCLSCHKPDEIALKTQTAKAEIRRHLQINLLHKTLASENCLKCHTDHIGLAPRVDKKLLHNNFSASSIKNCISCHLYEKPKNSFHATVGDDCSKCHNTNDWKISWFNHDFLGDKKNNCIPCHIEKAPKNELHQNTAKQMNCSSCHNTKNWKDATFDHNILGKATDDCLSCHQSKMPKDDFHGTTGTSNQCSNCHSTRAWKPSSFDHDTYFVMDNNHPATCKNCHTTAGNFKQYTCYNCHEHSQSKIASKHQEEGIPNFEDCVKCHRSGNEHDTKKGKSGENKSNERTKEGKNDKHKEKDDD